MNLPTSPKRLPDINYQELDWLFDKTKSEVFMGRGAGFLGSVMSTLNFAWTSDIKTACTNGVMLLWNPYFFLKLPPRTRRTILKHELWHVAYLDMLRVGSRDFTIWNYACDIRINNNLTNEGETFEGFSPWLDHQYDDLSPEEIYDIIWPQGMDALIGKYGASAWGHEPTEDDPAGDMREPDVPSPQFPEPIDKWTVLNNVIASTQSAKMGGGAGDIPGEVETVLQRFLSPKLPWHQLMFSWFNEKSNQDYSFRRPNRRFSDMYLPSLVDDIGGLDHVMFFGDVSGSVTDSEFIRYISEVKYIKEHFDPEMLTFVQFDTIIQKITTWDQSQPFDEVIRTGYGGTDLRCVRKLILEKQPTAVVVLSDLKCDPMVALGNEYKVPILWVAVNNASAKVNEGKLIFMRE
jgi:predicted metal-dependent peptidase